MKMAIQMESLKKIRREFNSSYGLIMEAVQRGWQVYQFESHELTLKNGRVQACGREMKAGRNVYDYFLPAERTLIELDTMDCLFAREDPPPTETFLAASYLLERLEDHVICINRPSAVRNHIEKMTLLGMPGSRTETMVTWSGYEIKEYLKRHGRVVVKPAFGFQGNGVVFLDSSQPYVAALIENLAGKPLILEPFDPCVIHGVQRATVFAGEVIGVMKFVPIGDEFRALSGSLEVPGCLTPGAEKLVLNASSWLMERGICHVGFDIIGEKIIDVNVLSPGCIQRMERVTGIPVAKLILDSVEKLC